MIDIVKLEVSFLWSKYELKLNIERLKLKEIYLLNPLDITLTVSIYSTTWLTSTDLIPFVQKSSKISRSLNWRSLNDYSLLVDKLRVS